MTDDEQIYNGGPAFPFTIITGQSRHSGMSLRDYFAGQALAGLLGSDAEVDETDYQAHDNPQDFYASLAYEYADSMLVERKKSK